MNYFKEQGQEMTPNNKQQALVIEGAKVLQNNYGMGSECITLSSSIK
jgi:nicotinamide-nucleotide amidase